MANPPYAITSQLLRLLLAPGSRLVAADLVLQRAAVHRHVEAWAGSSRRRQRTCALDVGRPLPRRAFQPPPQVDSAVLTIRRR